MPQVALLVGSLRAGSINRKLAHAIEGRARGILDLVPLDVGLPLYNEDLWADPPAKVLAMKDAVRAADAVMIVTPEYNRNLTPVVKNAIDWGSRPMGESCWPGKPATTIGASPGAQGTAVGQNLLRNLLLVVGMPVMPGSEVYLTVKDDFFDAAGGFANARTAAFVDTWIENFAAWIARFA